MGNAMADVGIGPCGKRRNITVGEGSAPAGNQNHNDCRGQSYHNVLTLPPTSDVKRTKREGWKPPGRRNLTNNDQYEYTHDVNRGIIRQNRSSTVGGAFMTPPYRGISYFTAGRYRAE